MFLVYNLFVTIASWFLIPVGFFSQKVYLFRKGREETFNKLQIINQDDKVIWIHCASLGEFEQGRPIIEKLHQLKADVKTVNFKIVLTFFSPSGYEIRKNYPFADVVCYLPIDTKRNIKKFIKQVHPTIAIFVKYEFWPNLLNQLKVNSIQTILVSGIFREKQPFFKKGITTKFMQRALQAFDHFFVQDEQSKKLLNTIGFNKVTISGDTRFDRVYDILKQDNKLAFIENFVKNKHILIAGSTWQQDEKLLVDYINNDASDKEKFIIAPHNSNHVDLLKKAITKEVCMFSDKVKNPNAIVFIVDTIGVLNKLYSYGHVAYVGGGFGAGIHNILEPATFGMPIIIGPKYQKFKEAIDLIEKEACFVIHSKADLKEKLNLFLTNKTTLNTVSRRSKIYVETNIGATACILSYISKNSSILHS